MTHSISITEIERSFGDILQKIRKGESIVLKDNDIIIARIIPASINIPPDSQTAQLIGILPETIADEDVRNDYLAFFEQKHSPQ